MTGLLGLTLALTVVLVWLNWGGIDRVNLEAGDFAANSLQVLQAKTGPIVDGHYSRFGFHHPGPALLYLLAIAEVVFFDGLNLVPSAFSAHLVAVALLNGGSIASIAILLRAITRTWVTAFTGTALFLAVLSWMNIQVFNSAWFPYMYALPFAAFLLAVTSAIRGRAFGLLFAAFFGGLLINGHASFLFIVPSVLLMVALLQFAANRIGLESQFVSRSWWVDHRRSSLAALGIFGAFLLPLIFRLVTQWPSPFREYASNGAGGASRDLAVGVGAFLANPRGSWVIVSAIILFAAIIAIASRIHSWQLASSLALVLSAATAVHLVYNIVGVDDAANSYLSYYFLVVPALVPTALVLIADQWSPQARIAVPMVIVALISLAYAAIINRTTAWPEDYQRADVLLLDQLIEEGFQTTVLDLDSSQDWGTVSSSAIGYVLLKQRQGNHRVCIRENWFIGFTDEVKCTPADLATGHNYRIGYGDSGLTVISSDPVA